MKAARFIVSGKVQGVWYRASTQTEAARLNVHGHAINLPDGRVEVLAAADAAALDSLQEWLQQGPPLARVDEVLREEIDAVDVAPGFRIG